eukprot:Awhi_evm1s3175
MLVGRKCYSFLEDLADVSFFSESMTDKIQDVADLFDFNEPDNRLKEFATLIEEKILDPISRCIWWC